ncbi:DUF4386 domain-containing protein [Acrocarpospora sp. B8E8]|uniref:DUF4386 domain-containing protein n=1 Tax=Acrocarpospora sp. B8E8 TaxID=3153572 RepID=UPI00325C4571
MGRQGQQRTSGRIVGALILLGYVAYIAGSGLLDSGVGTAVPSDLVANQLQISAGALLMLINSAAVVSIGVLVLPVLRPHHEVSAYAYLITRVFEAVMLAVGILCLLLLIPLGQQYVDAGAGNLPSLARVAQETQFYSYQIAMLGLGLGSILFCRALFRTRLVPRFMAVWGMAGYAIFAAGAALEVLGYGVGLALSVPGGLFEIALAGLLIAKGFGHPIVDRVQANSSMV